MLGKLSCNVGKDCLTINVMSSVATESHWKQFGKWIRQKRNEAGLTQLQVATKADITDVQFARIEKGESGTKRETVINIANAIGLSVAQALDKAGFGIPRAESILPNILQEIDLDGLDEKDLREISDFIRFKKLQKHLVSNNLTEETSEALAQLIFDIAEQDKDFLISIERKAQLERHAISSPLRERVRTMAKSLLSKKEKSHLSEDDVIELENKPLFKVAEKTDEIVQAQGIQLKPRTENHKSE